MDPRSGEWPIESCGASATGLLREGQAHQLAGRLSDAAEAFAQAIDIAGAGNNVPALAEALRRLGIVHHLQGETDTGVGYCRRSVDIARAGSHTVLAAEATMAMANMAVERGHITDARKLYHTALELACDHHALNAKIELNLGTVENIQGNLDTALGHLRRALHGYQTLGDVLGRAKAHHNIGMNYADRKQWESAHREYEQAMTLAQQGGDYHLSGLCLLNRAEVDIAQAHYDKAQRHAEAALAVFDRVGARAQVADANRMLGTALRFLKRPAFAESRLRSALEIATNAAVPLGQAEACRDIGLLLAETDRGDEALAFMDRAIAIFQQIGAKLDAAAVSAHKNQLLAA